MADLANRADVEELLRRFYGRVFTDDTLEEPFSELREKGLELHLPVMCDFWETVLFRAGLYRGNAFVVHRRLNDRHPLGANHFSRWLTLWETTVDEMYRVRPPNVRSCRPPGSRSQYTAACISYPPVSSPRTLIRSGRASTTIKPSVTIGSRSAAL